MYSIRYTGLVVASLLLCACSPAPEASSNAAQQTVVDVAPEAAPAIVYDTATTIEELMTAIVMPRAGHLWNAVSYVATAEGITETMPQTDEDWTALRNSAVTLIEAGNMLMIPGREILSSEFDPATANFQLTPDEITQLLADDPMPWQGYAQQLQEYTRTTLQAIELRDVMGLQEFGAEINEACEGCHATYWYRPPGTMVPQ